eukprot:299509-Hanusia_phi.AAC.4
MGHQERGGTRSTGRTGREEEEQTRWRVQGMGQGRGGQAGERDVRGQELLVYRRFGAGSEYGDDKLQLRLAGESELNVGVNLHGMETRGVENVRGRSRRGGKEIPRRMSKRGIRGDQGADDQYSRDTTNVMEEGMGERDSGKQLSPVPRSYCELVECSCRQAGETRVRLEKERRRASAREQDLRPVDLGDHIADLEQPGGVSGASGQEGGHAEGRGARQLDADATQHESAPRRRLTGGRKALPPPAGGHLRVLQKHLGRRNTVFAGQEKAIQLGEELGRGLSGSSGRDGGLCLVLPGFAAAGEGRREE